MDRKFLIAWLVTFVVWMVESMLVHAMLLSADYQQLPQLFRPEADAQQYMPFMLIAHVILAGALVWIYRRGIHASMAWTGQGLRFGIAIVLLTIVPTYLIYYCVQPLPLALVVKQIVFDGIGILGVCLAVAWWHRDFKA